MFKYPPFRSNPDISTIGLPFISFIVSSHFWVVQSL
nr:MAG TPA: Cytochrome c oxidase assembly protein [Bacteriophage sp.]